MKVSFFPWKLFRWYAVRATIYWTVCVASIGAFYWYYLEKEIIPSDIRAVLIVGMVSLLSLAWIVGTLAQLALSRSLVRPLGRLIERARHLRKNPLGEEAENVTELSFEAAGEWYDLERAINKLGRDFRRKTVRLSREKTELRAIMAAVSSGVIAVDPQGLPLFYNTEMALTFGLEALVENKANLREIIRNPDVVEGFEKVFTKGHGRRLEVRLSVARSDKPRDFALAIAPLRRKIDGVIYGAVGVFNDVTDLKLIEQMKSELVGNVSHELRTPLTAMKGWVETLSEDIKAKNFDASLGYVDIIRNNVERLIELVARLTDLSDLESTGVMNKSTVKIQELTQSVLQQLAVGANAIQTDYQIEHFEADSLRVEQVLRNLLQNAIQYAPEKPIQIQWSTNAKGEVVLSVRDEGPGIPRESQGRIFERFYRLDDSRATQKGGRGIGLSIVKHIMQKHGGYVSVESTEGKGTTFSCHFPMETSF